MNRLAQIETHTVFFWLGGCVGEQLPGMNAGIGTTGTCGDDICTSKFCQSLFQPILHGIAIWLSLPTVPRGAVVLNPENDAFHRLSNFTKTCRTKKTGASFALRPSPSQLIN